jgi:hypothetical protein
MTTEFLEHNEGPRRDYTALRRTIAVAVGMMAGSMVTWSPHEARQNDLSSQEHIEQSGQYTEHAVFFKAAEDYLRPDAVLPPWTVPNFACVYFRSAAGEVFNIVPQHYWIDGADNSGRPTNRIVPAWEYAALVLTTPACE